MFCNANLRSDGQPVGELSMGQQPVESSSSLPVFFQRKTKMLHTHMFHTFLGMIGLLGLAGVRLVWASLRCQDRRCSVVSPGERRIYAQWESRWATHDRHGRHDRHDAILFCTSRGVGCPLSVAGPPPVCFIFIYPPVMKHGNWNPL